MLLPVPRFLRRQQTAPALPKPDPLAGGARHDHRIVILQKNSLLPVRHRDLVPPGPAQFQHGAVRVFRWAGDSSGADQIAGLQHAAVAGVVAPGSSRRGRFWTTTTNPLKIRVWGNPTTTRGRFLSSLPPPRTSYRCCPNDKYIHFRPTAAAPTTSTSTFVLQLLSQRPIHPLQIRRRDRRPCPPDLDVAFQFDVKSGFRALRLPDIGQRGWVVLGWGGHSCGRFLERLGRDHPGRYHGAEIFRPKRSVN